MKKTNKQTYGVKEIARRANVSIATVDRVIHNRPGVAERTKNRINEIIREMDYQPNILASRLASRRVFHFAVLIPEVSEETDFWEFPLKGIQQAESEVKRYGVKIDKYFFDQNDKSSFVKQTKELLKSQVDGILLAPSFIDESVHFLRICRERKIPCVFINSDIPDQDNLCYIGPQLFHSGYLGASLLRYGLQDDSKVLVVNISKEIDNHHHLLRKEEGFRAYFRDNGLPNEIVKIDIRQTDHPSVERNLAGILKEHPDIKSLFVTNSRVSAAARYLQKTGREHMLLLGYDFLKENIAHLKNNVIDFLICQKPQEQGYLGIMALHRHLVLSAPVEKVNFMPIDIITKENYEFYRN